jgi:hypothetical protein
MAFPELESISTARVLRQQADAMAANSIRARNDYISGMQMGLGDDDLRHMHYDAMDAFNAAEKAHRILLGERSVVYFT